jgi:membrane protease YdiL (CAAX protease family)
LSVLAALAFALIHWSLGAVSLAFAFAAGVILMALFWRIGSTIPGIVVHYVVDLIAFA